MSGAPRAVLRLRPSSVPTPLASRARQVADLESLAKKLNPAVGFYDPLGLASSGMGEAGTLASEEAVIGFLRAAEIKVAGGLGPGPGLGLR